MSEYVYKRTEPQVWTVGFYAPSGKWESESDHGARQAMTLAIDLSSELAEGFQIPPAGLDLSDWRRIVRDKDKRRFHARHDQARFDNDLIPYITSAHLACGMHSGDPVLLHEVIGELVQHPIDLGAHPSYPF